MYRFIIDNAVLSATLIIESLTIRSVWVEVNHILPQSMFTDLFKNNTQGPWRVLFTIKERHPWQQVPFPCIRAVFAYCMGEICSL